MLLDMTISALSNSSPSDIHIAFIRAFSDYQIPVEVTLQEMLFDNRQRGVDYSASFGSFAEDGMLTGFILCGVRVTEGVLMYYDGATGVIPSYRRRGIARLLLEKAIADADSRGAHAFVLEVIRENLKAQKLYKSHGFSISRNLLCFQKQLKAIPTVETSEYEIYFPGVKEFFTIAEAIPLLYTPSWQNSFSSIASIFDHLTTRVLMQNGRPVGYFVLNPSTGHILQMSAEGSSFTIFRALISLAKTCTSTEILLFINLEEKSPLITFLQEEEWTLLVGQYEMIRYYKPKQDRYRYNL
jgi:GNAT superfamily N-acetyltransferase